MNTNLRTTFFTALLLTGLALPAWSETSAPTGTAIQPELLEILKSANSPTSQTTGTTAQNGAGAGLASENSSTAQPAPRPAALSDEDALKQAAQQIRDGQQVVTDLTPTMQTNIQPINKCEPTTKPVKPKKRVPGCPPVASAKKAVPKDAESLELKEEAAREKSSRAVTGGAVKEGIQSYKEAITHGAKVSFVYSPDQIFEVYCKPGHTTSIDLQPGEEILYIGGGDTARWLVDKAVSGSDSARRYHVYIKPYKVDISTNFVITTNRHSYNIRAYSKTWNTPLIGFVYPDEERAAFFRAQEEKRLKDESVIEKSVQPNTMNFAYEISGAAWFGGDKNWTPIRVYDDGTKTYIEMPRDMSSREAPVLFVKEEDSDKMALVNYRVKQNVYIVDRIFKAAVLKNGIDKTITITRTDS